MGFNSYRANLSTPLYAKPSSGAVAIARGERTGSAEAASGEKGSNGFPSLITSNQMMRNFMQTMKRDFRISPHRIPGVISTATGGSGFITKQVTAPKHAESRTGRSNGGVICFNCGREGHFSTGCTNVLLKDAKQKRIREQFRADRGARQRDTVGNGENDQVTGGMQLVSMVRSSQDGVNTASRVTEVISRDDASNFNTVEFLLRQKMVGVPINAWDSSGKAPLDYVWDPDALTSADAAQAGISWLLTAATEQVEGGRDHTCLHGCYHRFSL